MKTNRITKIGLLVTVALMVSYLETFLPAIPIPGVKVGLSNIVILYALYSMSVYDAAYILFLRIGLSTLLFSSVAALAYSLFGGLVSLLLMYFLIKVTKEKISIYSVSATGAIFHNLTQILVAVIILKTPAIIYLIPWTIIVSIGTGLFVGITTKYMLKKIYF